MHALSRLRAGIGAEQIDLGAAGSGMYRDDRIIGVMLATEHALDLGNRNVLFYPRQTCGNLMFGFGIVFLDGHVQEKFGLLDLGPFALPVDNDILELAIFLLYLFGPVCITPEVRGQGLPFQAFKLVFFPV